MSDIFDRVPKWVRSLYQIETELRDAARNGVFLQKEKALEHLAEARRHIDEMTKAPQSSAPQTQAPPSTTPQVQPPLRKDGDI